MLVECHFLMHWQKFQLVFGVIGFYVAEIQLFGRRVMLRGLMLRSLQLLHRLESLHWMETLIGFWTWWRKRVCKMAKTWRRINEEKPGGVVVGVIKKCILICTWSLVFMDTALIKSHKGSKCIFSEAHLLLIGSIKLYVCNTENQVKLNHILLFFFRNIPA